MSGQAKQGQGMKIRLVWKDACSGAVRKPVLTPPVAIGADFEQLPEKLGQRSVSRIAIADDTLKPFHAILMEEKGQLIAITPKDPSQSMADVLRSPAGVANAIQKQSLNNGDRFQLGQTPMTVQVSAVAQATAAPVETEPAETEPSETEPSDASPAPSSATPEIPLPPQPSSDEFSTRPTKLLDPDLDEDDDMITANDAPEADPNPANAFSVKQTKLLDPRLDALPELADASPGKDAAVGDRAGAAGAGAAVAGAAGAEDNRVMAGSMAKSKTPKAFPRDEAGAAGAPSERSSEKAEENAKTGCDRQVGFLFKRRCGRLTPTGCPYCRQNNSHDYDPYEADYFYYEHYGDYTVGHWGSDYYAERDRYYYNRDAGRMDFTEADAASFEEEFDNDYEMDMGAS